MLYEFRLVKRCCVMILSCFFVLRNVEIIRILVAAADVLLFIYDDSSGYSSSS